MPDNETPDVITINPRKILNSDVDPLLGELEIELPPSVAEPKVPSPVDVNRRTSVIYCITFRVGVFTSNF